LQVFYDFGGKAYFNAPSDYFGNGYIPMNGSGNVLGDFFDQPLYLKVDFFPMDRDLIAVRLANLYDPTID